MWTPHLWRCLLWRWFLHTVVLVTFYDFSFLWLGGCPFLYSYANVIRSTAPDAKDKVSSVKITNNNNNNNISVAALFTPLANQSIGNTSHDIEDEDPNTDIYSSLIESFDNLGLITPKYFTCYTVKRIVREVISVENNKRKRSFGIYFYVEETTDEQTEESKSDGLGDGIRDLRTSKDRYSGFINGTNSTTEECNVTLPSIILTGDKMAIYTDNNTNSVIVGADSEDKHESGLSKTQLMVIATCSAVIGTFFLIAAIMRIRNCIRRRIDENGDVNVGPVYHVPGGNLQNSEPVIEPSKKNVIKSKPHKQPAVDYDDGEADNSAFLNTPGYGDNKPLLVITEASNPNTPRSSVGSYEVPDNSVKKPTVASLNDTEDPDTANVNEEDPLLTHVPEQHTEPIRHTSLPNGSAFTADKTNSVNKHPDVSQESAGNVVNVAPTQGSNNVLVNIIGTGDVTVNGLDDAMDDIVENEGVTSGLCQSDTSLNSGSNPSYHYGNQAEYASNGYQYGNVAYAPDREILINELSRRARYHLPLTATVGSGYSFDTFDGDFVLPPLFIRGYQRPGAARRRYSDFVGNPTFTLQPPVVNNNESETIDEERKGRSQSLTIDSDAANQALCVNNVTSTNGKESDSLSDLSDANVTDNSVGVNDSQVNDKDKKSSVPP